MKTPTVLLLAALLLFIQEAPTISAQVSPAENTFGGTCTGSGSDKGSCTDVHALCSGTPLKCGCATDYVADGGTCKLSAASTTATCSAKADCVSNADCGADTKCHCATGFHEASGLCVATTSPAANELGGACTGSGKGTCNDAHAVCNSGTCACANGFVPNAGACTAATSGSSSPAANAVGGTCSGSGQGTCTDAHAECTGGPLTCSCITDYVAEGGTCKIKAGTTTAACSGKTDCVSHSDCSDDNCKCEDGYTEASGLCKEKNAGGRVYGNWAFLIVATVLTRVLLR